MCGAHRGLQRLHAPARGPAHMWTQACDRLVGPRVPAGAARARPPLGLGATAPAGSELPCALPRDEPHLGKREVSRFLPWPRPVPPPSSPLLPPGHSEEGIPWGLRPFEPGEPWAPAQTRGARSELGCGAECGWRVGLKGNGGGGKRVEGRGREPGVKPGSLAVYPNDFPFRLRRQ